MSNLYLSGGGDKEQTYEIDRVFAGELGSGKPLLYVPIAMNTAHISYEDCYKWIYSVMDPFGITDITMWTNLRGKTSKDLMKFGAVYIGGGNTFSLMHDILQSGFSSQLTTFIDEGGLIYGGSAGAIVMGSHLATCEHMDNNDVQLRDRSGLSYLGDYSIWCHYDTDNDDLIHRFIDTYSKPVIALNEETGLQVKNGRMEIMGTEPAYVFDVDKMKKRVEPKEFFSFS
ncbi:Type 1 glutamine amidotransferase-like domain-containing protein [Rossellomorea aquimaris]|uniref:Type 1 glutamine amidotransferase-like domain-containing protein n=1 Tax=Rossellomorea aquimaris TaxID=189382 RepID=UPI001CD6C251|nr:Type 1 glutamine amidotransferase-like domain-containing protein [Rossellomorea aquimaris]MCA1058949.1 Type 1 glutamine amidotransferase-like domain-containing protein [Rossellomorea aquimaris]